MNIPKLIRPITFKVNTFLLTFLIAFLFINTLPSLSSAATINASFNGGILNVDFGPPPIANGFWRISIGHKTNPWSNNILRSCGPGVTGWGPCGGEIDKSGHFERDYTAVFLAGGLIRDFWLVVKIESMDANGAPTGDTGFFSKFLKTPPVTLAIVGGNGQTGPSNTQLENPLTVKLSRIGQGLTMSPRNAARFVSWRVISRPAGASTGSFGGSVSTESNGEVAIPYTLGDLPKDYVIEARCSACNNGNGSTVTFTATAGEETLKLEKITKISLTGSAGEVIDNPLVVKVTDGDGNPESGVNVIYTIIGLPDGAVAANLQSPSKTTGGDGTVSASLRLGDKVGPYLVEATCGECTEGSPVTFTATVVGPEGCTGNGASIASQVNFASGNLFYTKNLLSLTGTGPQVNFTLAFNSFDGADGPLGLHWTHTYNMQITRDSDGYITLKEEGGRRVVFAESSANLFVPIDHFGRPGITLHKLGEGTYRLDRRDGTRYLFDAGAKLTEIEDRNGNSLTLGYEADRLITLIDDVGRITSLGYNSHGRFASLTDPAGRFSQLAYDSAGRLSQIIEPAGEVTSFLYDVQDRIIRRTEPDGSEIALFYDVEGRLIEATDASGIPITVSYQPETNQAILTDRDGGMTTYFYDQLLDVPLQVTATDGGMTTNTYDTQGNLLSTTDPEGNTTNYTYDERGNLTSLTNPEGNITQYAYEPLFNQITSITDPQGNVTTNTYDPKGNLISVSDPTGGITQNGYDAHGRLISLTDPQGRTTTFVYDDAGNLAQTTDPTGATTTMTYDSVGNLLSRTDASGATSQFEYDENDRLIKVTDPLGNVTRFTYDANGNRASQTDAIGRTTQYAYNYLNKLTQVTNPLGGITVYTYDAKGNHTGITDANGNTTGYAYDAQDRLTAEIDPLGNTIQYAYDSRDNLTSKTDAKGQTITYTYDALSRLLQKTFPDNTTETFTYDGNGRILIASNRHISYTFTHDGNGRMTSVTDSNNRVITYTYDTSGTRTRLTAPEGNVITYAYDASNRLSGIDSGAGSFTFEYDRSGRRTALIYPNGVTTSYTYDTSGRLTDLVTEDSRRKPLTSFAYTHDPVGNRLSKTGRDRRLDYTYDALDRLLQAKPTKLKGSKEKPEEKKAERFIYDPVGNRLTGPENRDNFIYNTGNQLTSDRNNQYAYDRNGNLIRKTEVGDDEQETWIYTYDFENRLIQVVKQEEDEFKTVTFKYDPFGRRVEKRIEEIEDGEVKSKTFTYVYDNEDIIIEYETKAKGDDDAGKVKVRKNVHGPGIDEPLAVTTKKGTFYHHADGLGSIVALTDEKEKVVESNTYTAFGEPKRKGNKVKNTYTFTGREWDKETGLYYYRARYYDAEAGRFLSEDPLGLQGGDINFYSYVKNNPVNNIDPDGRKVYSCTRALEVPLGGAIMDYLNRGHQFLWIDSADRGFGLAPKGWYSTFLLVQNPLLPVSGEIKKERVRTGSCSLVTDDPCREKKIMEVIKEEQGKFHIYHLAVNNCYTWVKRVIAGSTN